MLCLGFEPVAAEWRMLKIPMSFGGRPICLLNEKMCVREKEIERERERIACNFKRFHLISFGQSVYRMSLR